MQEMPATPYKDDAGSPYSSISMRAQPFIHRNLLSYTGESSYTGDLHTLEKLHTQEISIYTQGICHLKGVLLLNLPGQIFPKK